MRKRKRRLNKKDNKTIKYLVVVLLLIALVIAVGFAYSSTKPTKNIPDEVSSIVNQLNEVDSE